MGKPFRPPGGQAAPTASVAWQEHAGVDDPYVSCDLPLESAPGADSANSQSVVSAFSSSIATSGWWATLTILCSASRSGRLVLGPCNRTLRSACGTPACLRALPIPPSGGATWLAVVEAIASTRKACTN